MGFPHKWLSWISECINTPTFCIMLNGSPTGFFDSNRELRQGDPLSPYLFVIAMKLWSISLELSLAWGKCATIMRDAYNYVTHLLVSDDMLVFSKANKASLKEIKNILELMKNYKGLNSGKSTIFFSKECWPKVTITGFLF